ncbi:MAG: hypothetical protein AAGN82_17725 [Myxococcota bacterium]
MNTNLLPLTMFLLATRCAGVVAKPSEPHKERPDSDEAAEDFAATRVTVVDPDRQTGEPSPAPSASMVRSESETHFARMDTDGDGSLIAAELAAANISMRTWRTWDQDGDGRIDATEYDAGAAPFGANSTEDSSVPTRKAGAETPSGSSPDDAGWKSRYGVSDPDGGSPLR